MEIVTTATLEAEGVYFIMLMLLLLLPLLFFIISKNLKRSASLNSALPLPPGPTSWPHLGKLDHVYLTNLAKIHGPLISLKHGTKTVVVASSPSVAREILKTHDRILSGRFIPFAMPYSRSQLNDTSIVVSEECGDRWKYLRALCRTELFSVKALESQEHLREKKAAEMVEFLKQGSEQGKDVNIKVVVFATFFNILSNIMMSRDLINLQEGTGDSSVKVMLREIPEVFAAHNLSDLYPFLGKLDLQGLRKQAKKLFKRIGSMWVATAEERRKRKNQTPLDQRDFLDTLVDHDFSDDALIELFMELFTGGADTSSTAVEWILTELMKSPEAMKNLREEVDREINQNGLKESQIRHLPYLEACFKETMRIHPTSPLLIAHRAVESCQIENYTIPKNARVLVNVGAIGRDPEIWKEPLKFKPERFLNSSLDFKGQDFELLPFGGGRRICPGLPMASRQIPLIVACLVHYFEWSLPQGEKLVEIDTSEKVDISVRKEQPLLLIPRPRN